MSEVTMSLGSQVSQISDTEFSLQGVKDTRKDSEFDRGIMAKTLRPSPRGAKNQFAVGIEKGRERAAGDTVKDFFARLGEFEKGVTELKGLIEISSLELALSKAKELTGLAVRYGIQGAMKLCVGIQLVGNQGLIQRMFVLVNELAEGIKLFKQNLMLEGA